MGCPTRGTTNPNRLRRVDRWLAALPLAPDALVVDLGYGATPVTTLELARRLPTARVVGLEIDPERVAAAKPAADPPRLDFRRGGFELAGLRPDVVRAFNVLRQYTEPEALAAWETMVGRLAPGGLLVEGTCDEIGRRCSWVALTGDGPQTFTLSCLPADLDRPSDLAERLPKALIHRNVPGEPVHALLTALDACWDGAAPFAPFGPRARWVEAVAALAREWPVLGGRKRWRLGEVTVPWSSVSPAMVGRSEV
ncbi:class I SAM-dependent methyltransferase [Actinokineospora soli]|uniref:Class I SAM-dependent methyltransferase n=1 Tax=Actinokineospora soli TaxID=1048753 RepID=A0ABW2TW10_9PSEU